MKECLLVGISCLLGAPLLCSFLIAFPFMKDEKRISRASSWVSLLLLLGAVLVFLCWTRGGWLPRELLLGELYRNGESSFPILFFVDGNGVALLVLTALLTAIIIKYCRYYLHREPGYARFFVTILFFVFGLNLVFLSGSLDLLFAGWEVIGISSFLLIAFYRERDAPVRNALRAYSVYRFSDLGFLMAGWLSHVLWHHALYFGASRGDLSTGITQAQLLALAIFLLIAACGKSAQFPFCFWLPRAMEGPTPSSAIFYGALSIHAGVFLLLRTMPVWQSSILARALMASVGILSAIVATLSGRIQSNIKAQLGYASIAQVGVMLVELALGWPKLALLHLVANACLRCYQLLVSPSVVAHILRLQAAPRPGFFVSDWSVERLIPRRVRTTLYAFAFNEGYLSGEGVPFLRSGSLGATVFLGGILVWVATQPIGRLPVAAAAALSVLFSLRAMREESSHLLVLDFVLLSHLLAGLAVFLADKFALPDVLIYLSGASLGWVAGRLALRKLAPIPQKGALMSFHGLAENHPLASRVLFASFLCLAAFPISPSFLGQDWILRHASGQFQWLAFFLTAVFVANGIALANLFTRLSFGRRGLQLAA